MKWWNGQTWTEIDRESLHQRCFFLLSQLMPFACTHYIVQTNKHYELDARKTFLRNKWTSGFIKFMSILTLSAYLCHPTIQPSISFNFILLKRKKMVLNNLCNWHGHKHAHKHTRTHTDKETAQSIHREKKRASKNLWKIISLRIMNSSALQYIVLHTHLNHRPIKERARKRRRGRARERNEHKQGKSETLIIKIMA